MIGTGSHLLIVKKNSAWTNKELIVTPSDENFSCAVAYGTSSTYSSMNYDTNADGNTMVSRLQQVWNGKTVHSWQMGHKPIFHYCARSFGPWHIKSDSNANSRNNCLKILEMGGCRQQLFFNLHALPVGSATSFKAYLRFWNPSYLQAVEGQSGAKAYNYAHHSGARVYYHFDDEPKKPTQCQETGCGYCDFAAHANEGQGSNSGTQVQTIDYDMWGSHLSVASGSSQYSSQLTRVKRHFAGGNSYNTDAYYYDHEVTDATALSQLKESIRNGGVWAHIGVGVENLVHSGQSGTTGMWPSSTILIFTSRVEMRLVLTMPKINS